MSSALDSAYRDSQIALRASTLRDAIRIWPILDMGRTAKTYPEWFQAMRALVERDRATSEEATSTYLKGAWAEKRRGSLEVVTPELNPAQVETSLRVTSLIAYRRALGAGLSREAALNSALVQSSGSAARLVLDAGRMTAVDTAGRYGARWTRNVSGSACNFCRTLAGRGAVYRSEGSAGFDAHDHCSCTASVQF